MPATTIAPACARNALTSVSAISSISGATAPALSACVPRSPPVPSALAGQAGIALREALAAGDVEAALAGIFALDEAHRVEILLGAALRDAREDHRAARLYLAAEQGGGRWDEVVRALADAGADNRLDAIAASWVASGRAPERWTPCGRGLHDGEIQSLQVDREVDAEVVALLASGAGGLAILGALSARALYPPVAHYYRRGTIHALGCRPLLVLANTRV
jgi:hypothetical protein